MLPQVVPRAQAVESRGFPPLAMLVQVPTCDGTVQLLQASLQVASQQTPSLLQMLLLQSEFEAQAWPLASLLPQRWLVCRQVTPAMQSAFVVQVVRQEAPDPHM